MKESNKDEQMREKNLQNETLFRKLTNSIKCNNIHIIGMPEAEEKKKWGRKFI